MTLHNLALIGISIILIFSCIGMISMFFELTKDYMNDLHLKEPIKTILSILITAFFIFLAWSFVYLIKYKNQGA